MRFLVSKYARNAFAPARGAYSAPSDPLAVFKGPTSKGRGEEGMGGEGKGWDGSGGRDGRGGEGKERRGGERRGGKGGFPKSPPLKILDRSLALLNRLIMTTIMACYVLREQI